MSNILSSGPVQLPVDPSKLTTKELLNGGRSIPKPPASAAPAASAAKGIFGGRMAGILPGIQSWVTRNADTVLGKALTKGGSFLFGRDDGSANLLIGAMETADVLRPGEGLMQTNAELQAAGLMPKPKNTKNTEKATTKDLESIYHHPDLPGPASNRVGSDADTSTPGLQGPGAVPEMKDMSTADQQMFQWARNFKGLAEKVKPGQAGYAVIQQALGKAPTEMKDVDFSSEDAAAFGMPKSEQSIRKSGGFTEWNTDMDVDAPAKVEKSAQAFLKDRINSGFYAASSEQQPNFDGTQQPIGGDSPKDSLIKQDFENANSNPVEVMGADTPIGDIRIPNSKYTPGMFQDGAFPQLKGLGIESTYDPQSDSWRILGTTDRSGRVTRY